MTTTFTIEATQDDGTILKSIMRDGEIFGYLAYRQLPIEKVQAIADILFDAEMPEPEKKEDDLDAIFMA